MEKMNWSEIYSNSELAKEIGHEVISKVKNSKEVCTHDGVYHADDVFCTALLSWFISDLKVIRTRKLEENDVFTFDVGGGDFDHHHCDEFRQWNNGVFASFGKLWCTVGRTIPGLREEAWKEIDDSFVRVIDHTDNTGQMNPVNYFINSTRVNGVDDHSFWAAVYIAHAMLVSIIQSGIERSRELDLFEIEMNAANIEDGILELSKHYNVGKDVYKKLGIDWVLFPDLDGKSITVQAVGDKVLPIERRGLGAEGDIIFTHKGGWLAKVRSRKAALKLLRM